MTKSRLFFPQAALDAWLGEGRVDLIGDELSIPAEGRRYRIVEAAHALRELTGGIDANLVLGRVKTRAYLEELGAELLGTSMVLGDAAYEIVPGFLATPIGTFAEHLASRAPPGPSGRPDPRTDPAPGEPTSDEDLLARFLSGAGGSR